MSLEWKEVEIQQQQQQQQQNETSNGRRGTLFSWIISPSGRYGIDVDYEEIEQKDVRVDTHHFNYRFYCMDFVSNTVKQYQSQTGPFKLFYSIYWLTDNTCILVDFTKRDSSVRQNILYIHHEKSTIGCSLIYNSFFDVDDIARTWDYNAHPLKTNKGVYLLLSGFKDENSHLIYFRFIPFNPMSNIIPPYYQFTLNPYDTLRNLSNGSDLGARCHPLCYNEYIYVHLQENIHPEYIRYPMNQLMKIDANILIAMNREHIVSNCSSISGISYPIHSIPNWTPMSYSTPFVYQKDQFLIQWQIINGGRAHSRRKARIFILNLKEERAIKIHKKLSTLDFIIIHPNGSIILFHQNGDGRLKWKSLSSSLHTSPLPLRCLCQQFISPYSLSIDIID